MTSLLSVDVESAHEGAIASGGQLSESAPVALATVQGVMHRLIYANPAFCSVVKRRREELLTRPLAEILPEGIRGCLSALDRVYQTGSQQTCLELIPFGWLFSAWSVQEPGDPTLGISIQDLSAGQFGLPSCAMTEALMLNAVRDHEFKEESARLNARLQTEINERRQTEERLLDSMRELKDLKAAVDEHAIVSITDAQGRITYANDKFRAIFQYSSEELIGQDLRIVNSGFHPKEFIRKIWVTLEAGRVWKGEIQNRAKDGSLYWLDCTLVPFVDSAGRPTQYVSIMTDITTRKRSEEALREAHRLAESANQAKDQFIAALSHELRTPLTPILLTASTLQQDGALASGVRQQMELIRKNAELEAHLIDDLLDVTKIAQGKILLRLEEVDVHQVLEQALETVSEDLQSKLLVMDIAAEAARSRCYVDPIRIQQVFWNLIKNAAKFTPPRGKVTIRTSNPDQSRLRIEIRDSGMGIAPENLASLFAPFEQGAATGIHHFGGLGLGLTIAKAILDLHGGTIIGESQGLGLGATFTVELPVLSASNRGLRSPITPENSRTPALHILLVEDHEPTRLVLGKFLKHEGHHVESFARCQDATHAASQVRNKFPFQVLISDLSLPDGSGLELIGQIKALFPSIKAIALSGYGSDEDIRRSTGAGFAFHLVKPVTIQALKRALVAA